ncbi:hypothetical protein PSN45_000836 [Yamadazyma tenuis]|uniref:Uncharacterized protein n=1 Tax=Candida tenuis (strain ATCC 10573 / BCRC 21748 / CBS 615 / JCM 9827 / NBRC 10315 / NRRL Y-1498 / VKM Y-70) TaxID=590646 RepID=G3BB16_CANTC|nr:uncharacterized protein CANTEDRAFT_115581 [Yamadazyma tenuis ATCC 10573]XP_006688953.1 uncharacterized protein CANTEDRAFT_115581 [Yamadazyma tenuis ATCC 10573]EGV62782.1 hypothetical protein CANTEDRAFT_115581 [Yamadazyma tenuis ATCC 10573]EGV62783.1 hypothetical protein CANTEDRAFT_115581 [Yamadazyma tenuis ATCC 10573]WEJ93373.1 hypothetical protein PSN45_000836 [Yamadazyma tenuis]
MIRKNYSLAAELKKQESKKQNKIRARQKQQHSLDKLKNTDPIALYKKIQRLKENSLDKQDKYLKGLEADWQFILKNGLHKDKVEGFLKTVEKESAEREVLRNKLWGSQSVYFNPELNPLGKVPDPQRLPPGITTPIGNHTLPLKPTLKKTYAPDPIIEQLNITPPEGAPPQFYKQVYNTGRHHVTSIESDDPPKRFRSL